MLGHITPAQILIATGVVVERPVLAGKHCTKIYFGQLEKQIGRAEPETDEASMTLLLITLLCADGSFQVPRKGTCVTLRGPWAACMVNVVTRNGKKHHLLACTVGELLESRVKMKRPTKATGAAVIPEGEERSVDNQTVSCRDVASAGMVLKGGRRHGDNDCDCDCD